MKLGEKLTEGPIFKKFVLFVIPVIITSFLQQLYNSADMVYYSFPVTWIASGVAMTVAYVIVSKKVFGGRQL